MKPTASLITAAMLITAAGYAVELDVVYPRPASEGEIPVVAQVDSTFVFGSIHPTDCFLVINGAVAAIYPNGAFIAYVPLDYQRMVFEFVSCPDGEVLLRMPFKFPEPAPVEELEYSLPLTLKVTDSHSVMRYGSAQGVYYIFPALGALCLAEKIDRNYFGVRLKGGLYGWIEGRFTEPLIETAPPLRKMVYSLEVEEDSRGAHIIVPCGNSPLHRVQEMTHPPRLELTLYNLESHIDVIRNRSDLIKEIRWRQDSPEVMTLTIYPGIPRVWGYFAEIDFAGNFVFNLTRPPQFEFKSLKIALDPGHGGEDLGAIGPTRLTEKEVNLRLTLLTAEKLRKKGAEVFLTRTDDRLVGLYERMELAREWGADIFISLHNNALPDGKNPELHRGLGVYYYHPRSLNLARFLHQGLLQETGQPDNGLYYDNLAVPRTTYMPALLIETAFIIHPEGEMMLRKRKFWKRVAEGIYQGMRDFLKFAREEEKKYISNPE